MKTIRFWAVVLIVLVLAALFGRASADNPLTYDVYTVGQYTCLDFGEWGQCLCPCDATDCDATLAVNQPPGIGGGPPADDWIEVTPITTPTSEPIPTHRPEGEPTNTPPPTSVVIPTREPPPVKPIPTTVTDRPTPVPMPLPTTVPEDSCVGNPGNDKCKGNAGEKDESFNPPPDGPGERGRSDRPDGPKKPKK